MVIVIIIILDELPNLPNVDDDWQIPSAQKSKRRKRRKRQCRTPSPIPDNADIIEISDEGDVQEVDNFYYSFDEPSSTGPFTVNVSQRMYKYMCNKMLNI